jgi:hypothetical protein
MGTKMYQFQQKLKYIKQCIKIWNKEVFEDIFKAHNQLEQDMDRLHDDMIREGRTWDRVE